MSQWDYKIDQPMSGPFLFPNLRKGPGIEVVGKAVCFGITRPAMFPSAAPWKNIAVSGSQNILFPSRPVNKC